MGATSRIHVKRSRGAMPERTRRTTPATSSARGSRWAVGTMCFRDAALRANAQGGPEVAQQRDRREVGEPAGARVLGRHVLDLDLQRAELALDAYPVRVEGQPGHRVDFRPRLLRPDAGQREGG